MHVNFASGPGSFLATIILVPHGFYFCLKRDPNQWVDGTFGPAKQRKMGAQQAEIMCPIIQRGSTSFLPTATSFSLFTFVMFDAGTLLQG